MAKRPTAIHCACTAAAAFVVACGASKPPDATSPGGATGHKLGHADREGDAGAGRYVRQHPSRARDPRRVRPIGRRRVLCLRLRLEKKDIRPLNAIATCFTTGPMKGHSLKLVGRADPRGPTEYNMTLGQARSDSGQKYWTDEGVGQSSVQSTSRGAIDATGTDEAGWALDRRVDIMPGS